MAGRKDGRPAGGAGTKRTGRGREAAMKNAGSAAGPQAKRTKPAAGPQTKPVQTAAGAQMRPGKAPCSAQKQETRASLRKQVWKPGNMLYPLPAVLVSCADRAGRSNVFTVAWAGTVCTNPPMVSISVRPERYSFHMIQETGEFVLNLTTESLAWATDLCGVKSGRDTDKWKEAHLTPLPAHEVGAPLVGESPVSLECRVTQELPLGSHTMFLAEVVSVSVDEAWLDEENRFHLDKAAPLCYSHGRYFGLGEALGRFGYSVAKKKK